ncbi:MAG: Gfo/Idh/MocA family oxidoreductase [Verrucomicrobia bacterium]|nr:Gfo/Idh/MocA family oxidoreductase [Verrucomicrobiota bacterium]
MKTRISRREFLATTTAVTAFSILPSGFGQTGPNSKTTLACIGVGGQGTINLMNFLNFKEVQVVAVCDVNKESDGYISWNWGQGKASQVCGREPARRAVDEHYKNRSCKVYTDYRELLEKEDVDAVMVATPDHSHAVITMAALKKKKHVYCEKPLTWSVAEARAVAEEAKRAGVATQLGNQGQATEEAFVVREMIADGAIGPVHEVQVAWGARFWHYPALQDRPSDTPPVPEGLDWDLWLGPAPVRPYHPEYHPWVWRNWWDFGTGLLGDMGCHLLSTAWKALDLRHPTCVEASSTKMYPEVYPLGVIARWEFPARGNHPPLKLSWYDGGLSPASPEELHPNRRSNGVIYIGEKGKISGHRIIPEAKMKAYGKPPKTLPRSPGHYNEFVEGCRGGPAPGANFNHAGVLTETLMLGNVALRAGKKLVWDGPNMKITNDAAANKLLHRDYRSGWVL